MKSTMLKILTASLLCFSGVTLTHAATNHTAKSTHTAKSSKATHHAADSSKSVMQKELRACAKKRQGEWVSYSHNGATFNGTCQPNENGKLQFKAPAP
ncbi:signal peptide protein [Acinetobacter baumannii]|uniref:hypothetical protein n=1 Tax=Acinetobacter TaxID=469 RepID=UPI000574288B|nr:MULTISPECIES: hypothetical protein [Acinetobacter]KHO16180.1 signal peptide protein [Acinetobacter baumannii]ONN50725.1 hypothetical protein AC056_04735 [Acinetobacter genomosp. 33YU]PJG65925.1 hypothetical protein CVD09_13825 [Acinetobacter seifertii]